MTETDIEHFFGRLYERGFDQCKDRIRRDENMASRTSMRVGGSARLFAEPENIDELEILISAAKAMNIPIELIGNGTNVVVSDQGLDGLVIHLCDGFSMVSMQEDLQDPEFCLLIAQAGASLSGVAMKAARAGLSGMEFAAGIPGSIGGAVYMNAGAYCQEMKDVIQTVDCLDEHGRRTVFACEDLDFGYRESRFSKTGGIVLSATFRLRKGDSCALLQKIAEMNGKRAASQPLNMPSAGSVFKRPQGNFAGALIEQAGLKGFSIGGAEVSSKHAGFIVNTGTATAKDVYAVVHHVIHSVKEQSGVELEPEIRFIGEGFN
jgi:UDP-N-acetylmuramate dehydrogenase